MTPRELALAGLCPCCGMEPDWYDHDPLAIAEGVLMCGRCVVNEHHLRPPSFLGRLLHAVLTGGDVAADPVTVAGP